MIKKVYFRADGNAQIGLGHLVRCLGLAQMLQNFFEIVFICKEVTEDISAEIKALSFDIIKINTENDFFNHLSKIDIVILDHYELDTAYQKAIKNIGCKLICIDDVHNKIFYADLIINQAPNVQLSDYSAQSYTQFALGLDYALLRPVFLKKAKEPKTIKPVEIVFVCFGGSDNKNITQDVVEILRLDQRFKKIIIVVGSAYNDLIGLQQSVKDDERYKIYYSIGSEKMADLIASSGLAIVPASGILQEVLALGCKVISGMYVDNQKNIFEKYKALNAFVSAENFSKLKVKRAIDQIFEGRSLSNKLFIDGKSDIRLLSAFQKLVNKKIVVMRVADENDLMDTFRWATDRTIRAFAFSGQEITLTAHSDWFLSKITSKSCCYFIAVMDNKSIGSIRFDINGSTALISYLLDTAYHNQGLGIILLRTGVEALINKEGDRVKEVVGFVMPENKPSVRIFENLGYEKLLEGGSFKFVKKII